MAPDNSQPDVDLERTDELPMLVGVPRDPDVADDAVRLEFAPAVPSVKGVLTRPSTPPPDNLRRLEERIARQNVEYAALSRSYHTARDGEATALTRAHDLSTELTQVRALLELEQTRSRDIERTLTERNAAAAAVARDRLAGALREVELARDESRTLRESLAVREAALAQVRHSLAERDAQLSALQREHTQVVPALEERSAMTAQLVTDLRLARTHADALAGELKDREHALAVLTERLRAAEGETRSARLELSGAQATAEAYVEQLRTHEWRRGFDETVVPEQEDGGTVGVSDEAPDEIATLKTERDRLLAELAQRDSASESRLAVEAGRADLARTIDALRAEALSQEQKMAALLKLTQDSVKNEQTLAQVNEENRFLHAALERARTALDEREFLIGRMEGGNAAHADVSDAASAGPHDAAAIELGAELVRIDGQHRTAHPLNRRTRIGRAPGCELQIESSSVSRHHALVHVSAREVIVEDLNSTNGVLVNGRKVAREPLAHGDVLTIGEALFRVNWQPIVPERGGPLPDRP